MSIMCRFRRRLSVAVGLALGIALLAGCSDTPGHHTIGIVNHVAGMDVVLQGFKAQMAELGYSEGRHVTYVYHGVLDSEPATIEREVVALRTLKVDLLLALGTSPAIAAQKSLAGTAIPIVFAPVVNPVEEGLVERITRPGGNITGVQNGDALPKSLEWLHKTIPKVKRVHVVYHPNDRVALMALKSLHAAAGTIGVEIEPIPAHSRAMALTLVEHLPRGAALFLVPSPSLYPLEALIETAAKNGIAVAASSPSHLRSATLLYYGADFDAMGRQAAGLVAQIFKGAKPADLPVAKAEQMLRINLVTARRIGVDIQDQLLDQASLVIR